MIICNHLKYPMDANGSYSFRSKNIFIFSLLYSSYGFIGSAAIVIGLTKKTHNKKDFIYVTIDSKSYY